MMPPRVLASGPKPCRGNSLLKLELASSNNVDSYKQGFWGFTIASYQHILISVGFFLLSLARHQPLAGNS